MSSRETHTIAMIGLGRMGAAMAAHLYEQRVTVYGIDPSATARQAAAQEGIATYEKLADAIAALPTPRVVWLMVPSAHVDEALADLQTLLTTGDVIVEGGNSFYTESQRRYRECTEAGLVFIDCGVSGGVDGARSGASLMVGGDRAAVATLEWLFVALAAPRGYAHVGGPGAGHYVKMVHNAIEYGMMGAIAEGMHTLEEKQDELAIDIRAVLDPYRHGSIITSNLMDWLADAYEEPEYLEKIAGVVPRGETEPEMEYLVDNANVPVLAAALTQRVATRTSSSRVGTLIAAMRNQFGGHSTKPRPDGQPEGGEE